MVVQEAAVVDTPQSTSSRLRARSPRCAVSVSQEHLAEAWNLPRALCADIAAAVLGSVGSVKFAVLVVNIAGSFRWLTRGLYLSHVAAGDSLNDGWMDRNLSQCVLRT